MKESEENLGENEREGVEGGERLAELGFPKMEENPKHAIFLLCNLPPSSVSKFGR